MAFLFPVLSLVDFWTVKNKSKSVIAISAIVAFSLLLILRRFLTEVGQKNIPHWLCQ